MTRTSPDDAQWVSLMLVMQQIPLIQKQDDAALRHPTERGGSNGWVQSSGRKCLIRCLIPSRCRQGTAGRTDATADQSSCTSTTTC
ncbi:hypothetical protein ACFQY5_34510 [Paeniroseomonas aquatica]|uniref:Uncharacterized protein n=1 Tax=Paeniroseomonas aquatica TaxID=373043 RepID=A0ABT8A0B0_9PROT|nr:hypothetical protein [Paeniroseomonas aquatica]MDN3563170.1 hypothetical protein [Paeniroseomonas aquatica]